MDEALEKGKEEGKEEGREEVKEEGREEAMLEMLQMNINLRFGKISELLQDKIKSIKDNDKIKDLFVKSFSCENEDQFLKMI